MLENNSLVLTGLESGDCLAWLLLMMEEEELKPAADASSSAVMSLACTGHAASEGLSLPSSGRWSSGFST
jgi:hypothetical protein